MRFILMLAATLGLAACTNGNGGGSIVGNGTIHFHHPVYDYAFDYDNSLRLRQPDAAHLIIDTVRSVAAEKAEPSAASFEVLAVTGMTVAGLGVFAELRAPGAGWRPVTVSGVPGFFHLTPGAGRADGEYLYLLGSAAVLAVEVHARSGDDGLRLIAPIVDTLSFDTHSPVIDQIVFDPPVVAAGETVRLKLHATDQLTAIKGSDVNGFEDSESEYACRRLWRPHQTFGGCAEFKELGHGWYELSVATSDRLAPGDYSIFPIMIWDAAGNPREMFPFPEDGLYRSQFGDPQPDLPYTTVAIRNEHADATPPVVANPRFEPAVLTAGEAGAFVFEASDDDPAFVPSELYVRPTNFGELRPKEFLLRGAPAKRADGAWELPFTVPVHLPAGSYSVGNFSTYDAAGNAATVAASPLTVESDGVVDVTPPVLAEGKPAKASYHPGDVGSLLLRITDDLTPVHYGAGFIGACWGGIDPTYGFAGGDKDDNKYDRVPLCAKNFRRLDGDWYELTFHLGENVPTGPYHVRGLIFSDASGNTTNVYAGDAPTLTFNVVR